MILHNQTSNALRWTLCGKTVTCDPWGPVDIDDKFVDVCLKMGLSLGQAPVAPELRAKAKAKREVDAARSDEVRVLRGKLDDASAQVEASENELASVRTRVADLEQQAAGLQGKNAELASALKNVSSEKAALEAQIAEQAGKIADLEQQVKPGQPELPRHQQQNHNKRRR